MGSVDIIKDSLHYPLVDKKKWLILGVLFLIVSIFAVFSNVYHNSGLSSVSDIVNIIVSLFVLGFSVSIIASTIQNSDSVPDFNVGNNLLDGIKGLILYIVYLIIPIIITLIVAFVTGLFSNMVDMFMYAAGNSTVPSNVAVVSTAFGNLPADLIANFATSFLITLLVAIIVFILFTLFANIGLARMAETGSLSKGLGLRTVFNKIGSIGWGSYIVWYILVIIVNLVFGIISGILMLIPYVGIFIAALLLSSFMAMFNSRALGLIYNEG
jgi:hypothetical protein